ncbi:hypothetical protein GPJ56_004040 [Histomonas meleagridis]|uniref:uncharacterized protein n=1 Tax=Histomonas meleagridis TaxID=135588 RepID=UPI003559E945|nr:hypothetical protein GPJ56_004040 [Histomonas meleagridis]KAH0800606.1 hypothetical protein GO595_006359 [Histomonas meleagridis]
MAHVNRFDSLHDETKEAEEEVDQKENHQSPLVKSFLQRIENTQISSITELAEIINEVVKETDQNILPDFKKFFEEKNKLSTEKYESELQKQLNFIQDKVDSEFVSSIQRVVSTFDPIDIQPLTSKLIESSTDDNLFSTGPLLLASIIIKNRPDLLIPELFTFTHSQISQVGPIICFLSGEATLSNSISHLDPLMSHQLLELFLPELLNFDVTSTNVSICSSHLIANAFNRQKIYRTTAAHYVRLQELLLRIKTHRDKHVASVLFPIVKKLTVVDVKDLASQIFEIFPNAPPFACGIIIRESSKRRETSASFLDGWVEVHSKHKEASMRYLTSVFSCLPDDFINKFPLEDLKKGGDLAYLSAMKLELSNSSFRCIFLLFLVALIYVINKRYHIF